MIDRFGEAIEADLHTHYGLDLLDFFRGKYSWAKLDRLISELPADPSRSRFMLAQLEDEDMAEVMLDAPERVGSSPPLESWSPMVTHLAAVTDRLGQMLAATVMAAGGKNPNVPPVPRPKTAADRAKALRSLRRHRDLVAEVKASQQRATS